MMRTSRFIVGFGLIALVFLEVAGEPIVIDPTTENYLKCGKPYTVFKKVCKEQSTCDKPTGQGTRCSEGCFCQDGYVLNPVGDCILPEHCPGYNCPQNMIYSDCKSSVLTCSGAILYKKCPSGCFCKDGWVLNDNNICIPQGHCPKLEIQEPATPTPILDCPSNQTYKECSLCGRSCENQYINVMFKCACQPGCACKDGYIWKNNEIKQCIQPEDCTQEDTTCQDTQHYSSNEVRKTCLRSSGNGIPTTGCFCNDGLVYDEDTRTCMKPETCPNAQCGPRQSYHECYKNIVRTCQDRRVAKVRDVESVQCKTGCFCDGTSIWDQAISRCVHPAECQNSKENEICTKDDPRTEFKVCQSSTKPTCTNPKPEIYNKDCHNKCRCKENFVFNEKTEKCMTLEECVDHESSMNVCDSNSTYSFCATACPKTCANAYVDSRTMATCMACYEGCECKPGYYRTKDKRCVLIKDCPEKEIICPYDRQYKSCQHVLKTCSENVTKEDHCLRGCFCGDDRVQDGTGRCIYPSECDNSPENRKCRKSDVKSHYEECQFVKRTCSNPNGVRKKSCRKGCFCNDGYVYYKKVKRCVLPNTCNSY